MVIGHCAINLKIKQKQNLEEIKVSMKDQHKSKIREVRKEIVGKQWGDSRKKQKRKIKPSKK